MPRRSTPDFDPNSPNVVAFGDSNTYVFGRALRDWLVDNSGVPAGQVVVKFRSGTRPAQWLSDSARGLWTGDLKFSHGPYVAEALGPRTVLVLIGLGGNMRTGASERESIGALVRQVEEQAPRARILWRGPPPATCRKDGVRASVAQKLRRYVLNALVKREATRLGFSIVDADTLRGRTWGGSARRVYVDLMSLHGGGPASDNATRAGTAADLAFEREVLDSAPRPSAVAGEVAESGPWTSFVRGRDNLKTPTHVPRRAASDLITLLGAEGLLSLDTSGTSVGKTASVWRVVDGDSRIRSGPPKFRWTGKRLPVGALVRIEATEGKHVYLASLTGVDEGWTVRSNLMPDVETARVLDPGPPPPLVVVPDVYTVTDRAAWLRDGPPRFEPRRGKPSVKHMARVRVDRTHGLNSEVRDEAGNALGWTRSTNLTLQYKDTGRLLAVPLRPQVPAPTSGHRAIRRLYARVGGLMGELAREVGIEDAAAIAVWMAESSGTRQQPKRMTIRFENHVFFKRWGKANPERFDAHFRFEGRHGEGGKRRRGHMFRTGGSRFREVHDGNQGTEYEALALAIELGGKPAAYKSISMGGPQIMGFNHRTLGFATPSAMYDAFQAGERAQILAFFDFLRSYRPGARLIRFLQQGDWLAFARAYNGSAAYEKKVRKWYERARAVRRSPA
ncbi:MAG: N-acetylmuramidase domain-containing protein [Myxococcota bacterium]